MNYARLILKLKQSGISNIHEKMTKKCSKCITEYSPMGLFRLKQKYNPSCLLSKFAYLKKKELIYHGKADAAVGQQYLRIGLSLLHHHDIYSVAKEDGFEKLKVKLAGY